MLPKIKYFLRLFEKLLRLGLSIIQRGSSFHNFGPEKSTKRLRDSSLEIELVKLDLPPEDPDPEKISIW